MFTVSLQQINMHVLKDLLSKLITNVNIYVIPITINGMDLFIYVFFAIIRFSKLFSL